MNIMTKMLNTLYYTSLNIEEFGQSNIPDGNLYIAMVHVLDYIDTFYSLSFNSRLGREAGTISVLGQRSQISEEPKKYSLKSFRIDEVLDELQKGFAGKVESIENPDYYNLDKYLIKNSTLMTQKGIAEVVRNIDNKLKFKNITVKMAEYREVIPIDPVSRDLGFNLPSKKISSKTWAKEKL